VYKYILRRLLQMIPVLLGATFIIFTMVFALPGDPTAGMCGDRPCSPTFIAQFKKEHNLNDPLLVRYGKYMANVAQGDLGTNFRNIKVQDDLKTRYPTTIKLAGMAIIFETVLGIIAGVLAGVRKGRFIDQLVLVSTLVVISVPTTVKPNTTVKVGSVSLVLNQQIAITGADNGLIVNAIAISANAGLAKLTATVASATSDILDC